MGSTSCRSEPGTSRSGRVSTTPDPSERMFVLGPGLVTQPVDEPDPRSVDVQQAEGAAGGPEAMLDVRRHRDERAWAGAVPLAVEEELDLAFEHVERVGVVWMGVRIDALEVRVVRELER